MTVGIIGIIRITRRVGIFVGMRLRHFGFFSASTVIEDVFLGNYVRLGGLIMFPVRDDEGARRWFLRSGRRSCVLINSPIRSHYLWNQHDCGPLCANPNRWIEEWGSCERMIGKLIFCALLALMGVWIKLALLRLQESRGKSELFPKHKT